MYHLKKENDMDPYISDREFVGAWLDYLDMFFQAIEHSGSTDVSAMAEKIKIGIEEKEADAVRRGYMPVTYRLRTIFRLSDFFWKCVLLSVAGELDMTYGERIARLQGDLTRTIPQVSLALKLFGPMDKIPYDDLAELGREDSIFRRFFMDGSAPFYSYYTQLFVPRRRLIQFMLGSLRRPDALEGIISCPDGNDKLTIHGFYDTQIQQCCNAMAYAPYSDDCTTILYLFGADCYLRKRIIIESYFNKGFTVYFLDMSRVNLADTEQCRCLLDQVIFEALMNTAVVCVDWQDGQQTEDRRDHLEFVLKHLSCLTSFVLLSSDERMVIDPGDDCRTLYIEVSPLNVDGRMKLWAAYLKGRGPVSPEMIKEIASKYIVTEEDIKNTVWEAAYWENSQGIGQGNSRGNSQGNSRGNSLGNSRLSKKTLEDVIKNRIGRPMGKCASLIPAIYGMVDIVLEAETKEQLSNIINQLKYQYVVGVQWGFYEKLPYGRGICALFFGAPGTGKTMAAQVVANELGYDLYRVDISQILNKYIGETEKNVADLFFRAKNQNIILFFDEADALFAKRMEVNSSNDRSANAETAFLLQQIEDYEGITILATNHVNNIDAAFKRRIRYNVNFVAPGADLRLKLWHKMLPEKAWISPNLDLDFFARQYDLCGANIQEILINSAFLAASEGTCIDNGHLVRATCSFYKKSGKVMAPHEFGPYGYVLETKEVKK